MAETPWAILPQSWTHIELPGYLEFFGTYGTFARSELPPIPIELDDDCRWLLNYGEAHSGGLDVHQHGLEPANAVVMAIESGITLPQSFRTFMCVPELQRRVRSCTDCYLDPGERVVTTVGSIPGHLIHFLSDSQSCAHWYLHVIPGGEAAVLESPELYCYRYHDPDGDPSCALEQIDLKGLEFSCCADSFSEFLFRFWIENEIWYALAPEETRRPLTSLEAEYVRHYRTRTQS